jgi:hypothetical protein
MATLPSHAILPLVLVTALLLVASLCGLAASGHFPHERRAPALRSGVGAIILFGSLAASALCLAAGLALAWGIVPWYAAVIGGGAAILGAPMALRSFPDRFVDGRGALIAFAGASVAIVLLLAVLARTA